MNQNQVSTVIENYKNKVKELGNDPNPGHKAIVVYGGYMGKTFQTHAALNDIGLEDCYPNLAFPYKDIRDNWIYNIVSNNIRKRIIILDSYKFPYISCKEEIPEYNELITSISQDKFGFSISKPFKYVNPDNDKNEVIPVGFYKIKSNLIFIIGHTIPNDLISIMPSYNFNFEGKQLLEYLRDNVDTIFPDFDILTHEVRLELIDLLGEAYEIGTYEELNFKWIEHAFNARCIYEEEKKKGKTTEEFNKTYARKLALIKDKKIQ